MLKDLPKPVEESGLKRKYQTVLVFSIPKISGLPGSHTSASAVWVNQQQIF